MTGARVVLPAAGAACWPCGPAGPYTGPFGGVPGGGSVAGTDGMTLSPAVSAIGGGRLRFSFARGGSGAALAVASGFAWSVLFVAIGVGAGLEAYGDGALFSYAVAADSAWAFHWHNIPGRFFTYLFAHLPAETYGALTGDAHGAIVLYGTLFFVAPLLGLIATFAADRSEGRIFFVSACAATAVLCPLVFGFPTETWMAHALFWPTLALCHAARPGASALVLVVFALLALLFTHEGALLFAAAIVVGLIPRGLRDPAFRRAGLAASLALALWILVHATAKPDPYFAGVFSRAALHVFDPEILRADLVLLFAGTLTAYGIAFALASSLARGSAPWVAASLVLLGLGVYWLRFDHALHAEDRYYLRTLLLVLDPAAGLLAAGRVLLNEGRTFWPLHGLRKLAPTRFARAAGPAACGALLLVSLVHAVETAKFVAGWERYRTALRTLTAGPASDPRLGDPRFVSAERLAAGLDRLAWSSTTPFLSVLLAPGYTPARLVIDPRANYFWLPCPTARAHVAARGGIPVTSRQLIETFSCQRRP